SRDHSPRSFLFIIPPPPSTTLFPYTTLFRSHDAVFAIPAVKLGLGYGYQGQIRLNRLIGSSQARDLYFTGRRYSAEEALRMGLVDRKSTRLNSSHVKISYAVFCLKKKKHEQN